MIFETSLPLSPCSFVFKNQSSLFCCSYFLFFHYCHNCNHYYCLFYSHIIWLYFEVIFYRSLLSIIILIVIKFYIYFLSFYLFPILSSFLFHFSSFFSFFATFVRQMSPSCASFACHYIQFYPYWPFKNPPRKTPRPSKLSAKLKSLFPLLLYYYRSWASWTILYSISLQYPPILNSLKAGYPSSNLMRVCDTHNSSYISIHVSPLKKVRYIIITTAVRVCNWQHFLLITIVIIILINKIINHHNQCIFVQPSTHGVASKDSSYIFLEKGNKTTSKFSQSWTEERWNYPLFSTRFFAVSTHP